LPTIQPPVERRLLLSGGSSTKRRLASPGGCATPDYSKPRGFAQSGQARGDSCQWIFEKSGGSSRSCGESLPDVGLLPMLAALLGITIDELPFI